MVDEAAELPRAAHIPEVVPELPEAPQPKKRGRPPGSKNRPRQPPPQEEEEEEEEEAQSAEEEDSEPEEAAELPRTALPPPAKPVRMTPPRAAKEPKRQKSRQPRANTPHPTAGEIAEAMLSQMSARTYNRSMQRQALYSSWM